MNATTPTVTPVDDDRIAAFAAAVRARLDDLPADDVDDLLDGLEADLVEQAADRGEDELPDAAAYADELRAAAGLPERVEAPDTVRPSWYRQVAAATSAARGRLATRVAANPAGRWIIDLAIALRPVWWVLRGGVLFLCVTIPLGIPLRPDGPIGSWLVIAAFVILSIQWGRGRWLPYRWVRGIRSVVNVVTAVAGVLMLTAAPTILPQWFSQSYAYGASDIQYIDNSQPGLVIDGERVRNIFAYDAEGNPIDAVQLYDQSGRPLTTTGNAAWVEDWRYDQYFLGGGGPVTVPETGADRQAVWNVFPLRELDSTAWQVSGEPDPSNAAAPAFPFTTVPSVQAPAGATPTPTPVPTPTPTDAASDAAEGAPTAADPATVEP